MDINWLFVDGSVDTQTKIGFGAYLFLTEEPRNIELLRPQIRTKKFRNTSSTKLELENVIWVISNLQIKGRLIIYTDSQNLTTLPQRRVRLESQSFRNTKNALIRNHELYREFFELCDVHDLEFIKVRGHKKSATKDHIDRIFALVDKAARRALKESRGDRPTQNS